MVFDTTFGLGLMMSVAVALIAISTCQFVAIGVASGRASAEVRQRLATDLRGLRQAAQVARLNSELQASPQAVGIPWRVMEVAEIIDESADCRSFYLVDPYRQPLPMFLPGQHVLVRPALAGAYQTTRCYSLSSTPDDRYWRITVKRQEAGAGETAVSDQRLATQPSATQPRATQPSATQPSATQQLSKSGGLSAWLHATVGVGDCLLVGGPNGHFHLDVDSQRPLVLLAAGVGITPMASMLRWSMQNTPHRPVRVWYQAKDTAHWPLGPALHSWTRHFPACQVFSYFSRGNQAELDRLWVETKLAAGRPATGCGEFRLGRFTCHDVWQALPDAHSDFFLCGPHDWMDSLRGELIKAGVAENRIHWESFGSALPPQELQTAEHSQSLSVRFEASGVEASWAAADQSLWELAREHQIEIPSGCLSGVCGCCRVKLLSGTVRYDRAIALEMADDECLACVARPETPCCIDA
jgi:uncharacterized protein